MKLYRLGELPGYDSMLGFHAMAYLGLEGLVLVSPGQPIVTIGYFQDANTAVDREYCKKAGLAVMRREVGGGTTLLDNNQIFFQVILHQDNPLLPKDTLAVYRNLSEPVIAAYNDLGIKVKFKEVNDLLTVDGNRKITGEGGADIGQCLVFVGGILLDFDCEMMSRVFPVPNEDYRAQLLQTLQNNVTSVKRELGYIPAREQVEERLIEHFFKLFGKLKEDKMPDEVWAKGRELEKLYTSEEFIQKKGKQQAGFKVASGVHVYENRHKAVGGTIHAIFTVKENKLETINLYGDFTFLPKERLKDLEKALSGTVLEDKDILRTVQDFIKSRQIDCPGLTPQDFSSLIMGVIKK